MDNVNNPKHYCNSAIQPPVPNKVDMVNHPPHYKLANGMETKEILKQLLTSEEYRGWCKGNALKYQFRAGKKDPTKLVQDYEKTQWFLRELVEVLTDEKQD